MLGVYKKVAAPAGAESEEEAPAGSDAKNIGRADGESASAATVFDSDWCRAPQACRTRASLRVCVWVGGGP